MYKSNWIFCASQLVFGSTHTPTHVLYPLIALATELGVHLALSHDCEWRWQSVCLVSKLARDASVAKVNRHYIVRVYFLTSLMLHRFLRLISVLCVISSRAPSVARKCIRREREREVHLHERVHIFQIRIGSRICSSSRSGRERWWGRSKNLPMLVFWGNCLVYRMRVIVRRSWCALSKRSPSDFTQKDAVLIL